MDETRDPQWRQGWLAISMPPVPVLAVTTIVAFFLYLRWEMDEYEKTLHRRTQAGFWMLLALGLLALAVLARHALVDGDGRVVVPVSWRGQLDGADGDGSGTSPWSVAAVVALLLVLASHKSSFQMFRLPWHYK